MQEGPGPWWTEAATPSTSAAADFDTAATK